MCNVHHHTIKNLLQINIGVEQLAEILNLKTHSIQKLILEDSLGACLGA